MTARKQTKPVQPVATATIFGRQPSHRIYRVSGEGEAATWTPIGAAWPNKDGKGFNFQMEAMPIGGRVVMRAITPKEAALHP